MKISVFKVNKSVYVAKLEQRYDKTLNNFLLHLLNHAIKDMNMPSYVTINNTHSLYYGSIEVLIDFINSFSLELHELLDLRSHEFLV